MQVEPSIAAVIVLYQEELRETKTFQTLLKGGNLPFIVYDNSPKPSKNDYSEAIKVFQDPTNPGVSKAYNQACTWAKRNAFTHLLLLDSDSVFPENAISYYKRIAAKHPNYILLPEVYSRDRKISPFYFRYGKSFYGEGISYGIIDQQSVVGINSGLLVPLRAFDLIGGFKEDLPLDWSDLYFLRQAKKKGLKLFHFNLQIKHGLSEHQAQGMSVAKFRFLCQLKAVGYVTEGPIEKGFIYLWLMLKSIKLSLHFKSFTFIKVYLKNLYA